MTTKEILQQLKSLGDDARRKHNIKAGAGDNQFGVKMGDIRALAKKLKTNHALALKLWETGNIEARQVAILIMDVRELSADDIDAMVRSLTFAYVADWLMSYVIKDHPEKESLREMWMADDDKWAARAGWALTAGRAAKAPKGLDLAALLDRIESEMPDAPPETQWTMNTCLAEIGIHHAKQRRRAISIGESLGIYRDYPVSKGCVSPFAPIWINEMVKRNKK
ncbi:MAG TPA: DNA alkylation repair protein [Phycisphaerae bacterium]|nr:DNA alkylation repair protein [Phycisphaerae bacterium]HRW52178.1 DNA alkylation repair protein [Phycisphaerae bacterium]